MSNPDLSGRYKMPCDPQDLSVNVQGRKLSPEDSVIRKRTRERAWAIDHPDRVQANVEKQCARISASRELCSGCHVLPRET